MLNRLRMGGLVALAVLGLMPAPAARAQGCVLCYTSLSAASPGALHAFQLAMLVLLIPALLLFAGLFLLIWTTLIYPLWHKNRIFRTVRTSGAAMARRQFCDAF
jgi:hypothetical protein